MKGQIQLFSARYNFRLCNESNTPHINLQNFDEEDRVYISLVKMHHW